MPFRALFFNQVLLYFNR